MRREHSIEPRQPTQLHADKDFEGLCQRIDPGVWGVRLMLNGVMSSINDRIEINPSSYASSQINSFKMMNENSTTAVNSVQSVEAEGECQNMMQSASWQQGKCMRQHGIGIEAQPP